MKIKMVSVIILACISCSASAELGIGVDSDNGVRAVTRYSGNQFGLTFNREDVESSERFTDVYFYGSHSTKKYGVFYSFAFPSDSLLQKHIGISYHITKLDSTNRQEGEYSYASYYSHKTDAVGLFFGVEYKLSDSFGVSANLIFSKIKTTDNLGRFEKNSEEYFSPVIAVMYWL